MILQERKEYRDSPKHPTDLFPPWVLELGRTGVEIPTQLSQAKYLIFVKHFLLIYILGFIESNGGVCQVKEKSI